jgi:hypothetical protein
VNISMVIVYVCTCVCVYVCVCAYVCVVVASHLQNLVGGKPICTHDTINNKLI